MIQKMSYSNKFYSSGIPISGASVNSVASLSGEAFDDVLRGLEAGRSPVVITERTAHLETIAKRLERFARHVIVLRGGQGEKQRRDVADRLASIPQAEERVIVVAFAWTLKSKATFRRSHSIASRFSRF
jgi:hypothetical protein